MTASPRGNSSPAPVHSHRVLVLLLPDVHLQDMAGPVQVFSEASELGGAYRLTFCATEPRVRSAQGLILADLQPLPAPREGDLVLVPGISTSAVQHLDGTPSGWLAKAHLAGARIASICSGAFVLARAEQDFGPLVVARVAREMVIYLRRSGDQDQQSVYLDHRTHLHPGVHQVQDFIVQHPDQKLTIAELSRIAAMSPRNLTRMFHRATGVTPKQFASKVRLQVARDLIDDPR